jgi:hypothetical protein
MLNLNLSKNFILKTFLVFVTFYVTTMISLYPAVGPQSAFLPLLIIANGGSSIFRSQFYFYVASFVFSLLFILINESSLKLKNTNIWSYLTKYTAFLMIIVLLFTSFDLKYPNSGDSLPGVLYIFMTFSGLFFIIIYSCLAFFSKKFKKLS